MFESSKGYKFAEEDVYQEGCKPGTGSAYVEDAKFEDATLGGIIDKIKRYFDIDSDEELQFNACEEVGRLDIVIMEDRDGIKANERDIEDWKIGEKRLWYCIYTYRIWEVDRKPVNLEEVVR